MPIRYENRITRSMLRAEPEALFVFGDNFERRGLGGQAKEMRGEPNAIGIPTKRAPHMGPSAFLTNEDGDVSAFKRECYSATDALAEHLANGGTVVLPNDGIGTGLADLKRRSPRSWAILQAAMAGLLDIPDPV